MSEPAQNQETIRLWNEEAGPRWVALMDGLDGQMEGVLTRVLELAAVKTGERVLDVGCGCGATLRALVPLVGAAGSVTGIDVSEPMLARAKELLDGVPNVDFLLEDAQEAELPADSFDLVFSRFGLMFFADPQRAFATLLGSLREGGRLAFCCWRDCDDNSWVAEPLKGLSESFPLPAMPGPNAPGPFGLADGERTKTLLAAAGFVDVKLERVDLDMLYGGRPGLQEAVDFGMIIGPAAGFLREAGESHRELVATALKQVLARYEKDGEVWMKGSIWMVSARRPTA